MRFAHKAAAHATRAAANVLLTNSSQALRPHPSLSVVARFSATAQTEAAFNAVPLKEMADSYLDGTSLVYLEQLHADWREGKAVEPGMEVIFRGLESGKLGEYMAAELATRGVVGGAASDLGVVPRDTTHQSIQESMRLLLLVRAFQVTQIYLRVVLRLLMSVSGVLTPLYHRPDWCRHIR